METSPTCPHCGLVLGAGELVCPKDGTRVRSPDDAPGATMLDDDEPEGEALEPTLIRKRAEVGPASTMEDVVYGDRTQKWDPLLGARLGEYVVEERIGTGGMGIVYRGRQPEIGKAVAIKVLRPEIADDPEQVKRLLAEARAVNAIGHRGIIDIFSFGRLPDGRQYFVMELLTGVALDEEMARRGALPADEVLALLEDMLPALGAAHAAGVIHRDLKPSNLFLVSPPGGTPYLKLLDFGLARQSAIPGGRTPQTRNVAVGTAEYMAPEQGRGWDVGPFTDLYSVGVMAYEMVTGRLPFTGASPVETIIAHLEKTPERPSALVPGLLPELEELILHLLAKEPADRPQTADAVRREVRRVSHSLRQHHTQPAAMALPEPPRPGPPPNPDEASALATPATPVAADLVASATKTAPNAAQTGAARAAAGVVPQPGLATPMNAGDTKRTSAYRPDSPSPSRWPLVLAALAIALTVALGAWRAMRNRAPNPTEAPPESPSRTAGPPAVPAFPPATPEPAAKPEPVAAVSPLPPAKPEPATAVSPPVPAKPEPVAAVSPPPPAKPEPPAAATPPEMLAPLPPAKRPPERPPRKHRPPPAKRAPSQAALIDRIDAMKRELARSTPRGEDPDPNAIALLSRAAQQTRSNPDEAARRRISQGLDELQRKYLK